MAAAIPIPRAWPAADEAAASAASARLVWAESSWVRGPRTNGSAALSRLLAAVSRAQRRSRARPELGKKVGEPFVPGHGLCSQSSLAGPFFCGQHARGVRELRSLAIHLLK